MNRTSELPKKLPIDQSIARTQDLEHNTRDHLARRGVFPSPNTHIQQRYRVGKRPARPMIGIKSLWAACGLIAGTEVLPPFVKGNELTLCPRLRVRHNPRHRDLWNRHLYAWSEGVWTSSGC